MTLLFGRLLLLSPKDEGLKLVVGTSKSVSCRSFNSSDSTLLDFEKGTDSVDAINPW